MVGNNPDINYNGRLIGEFVYNNDLRIVNADKDRCSGTFTRVVANSVSLLDLVIEGGGPTVLVHSMVVDELNQFLAGSDHSPLIVTLNVGAEGDDAPVAQEIRVPNPSNLNKDLFQYKFMTLCEKFDWGSLDVSQKCEALQNTLVLAADQAGVPAQTIKRSSVASKALGRPRACSMRAEAVARIFSIEQRVTGFPQSLVEAQEAELAEARRVSSALILKIGERVLFRRRICRNRLRLMKSMTSKQFWRLVWNAIKKAGSLSALPDANGVMATARARIEEIVLQALEKIFSGQRSKIFSHRNEQLVKEIAAAAGDGWRCRPVSEHEVEKVIAGLKENRAPGVDQTSSMLKLAGLLFIRMFTGHIIQTEQTLSRENIRNI